MSELTEDNIEKKVKFILEPMDLSVSFNAPLFTEIDISDERLSAAYETLASIISVHGDIYLPLFKRLHEEIELRKKNDKYKLLAKAIHERSLTL